MFGNYVSAALRNLARNGAYAGVTIAGLAIAFAAAILIGLYVRDELSYDHWVPNHERIYLVQQRLTGALSKPITEDNTPAPLVAVMKLDFPEIEYAARLGFQAFPPAIRHGDVSFAEQSFLWADPDFFKIFRIPVVAGDAAHALERPDALVLTRTAARKYFGQDAPIGGVLQVNGQPMRVGAVIDDWPKNSNIAGAVFGSTLAPQSLARKLEQGGFLSNNSDLFVQLKPGASPAVVNAAMPGFVARRVLPSVQRQAPDEHIRIAYRLEPIGSLHLTPVDYAPQTPHVDPSVVAAIGVIGALIVIVAAINFITLMTARASRRAVEVGVRKALGASRGDLVAQFMGEAMLYVLTGLVAAVAIAEVALPALNAGLQRNMRFDYLGDPSLLAAMLVTAIVVGLLAGVYPALVLSAYRPALVLKGGPVEAAGGGRVRQGLVVAQFAVLITLLLAVVTIGRQTAFALTQGTHLNQDAVLLLAASPCSDTLRDAVRAVPGVRGAACASPGAIQLSNSVTNVIAHGRRLNLTNSSVDLGFFGIYGIKPLAGRLFSPDHPSDDAANLGDGAMPPIVINETAVRALGYASPQVAVGQPVSWEFFPDETLSNYMTLAPVPYRSSEIIGVVPDFTFGSVKSKIEPSFWFVGKKNDVLYSSVLNIRIDPAQMTATVPRIDKVWKDVSHGEPLTQFFANQFMLRLYVDTLIQGAFIAVCALIAVSVACLGLFALSAYTAERRTKEIGVRKAMGASSADILKLLLWQFLWPVLIANLIAWPLAFLVMNWWLQGFAYRVDQAPWTFFAAGGAAVVIALATVFVQALRVSRAKPVSALRYE
ncbi:MAG TPA: FtsX-like permease family protein [Caulobacteraceae bacterium]